MMDPLGFLQTVSGHVRREQVMSQDRPIRLATIDPAYDPTDFPGTLPLVTFDGESTLSGKRYPVYSPGYVPSPGDRVVMLPVGNTYIIIGALDAALTPGTVDFQQFTANDTFDNPGVGWAFIEAQAGGGAGGGAPDTGGSQTSAGAGGQGGGYAADWFDLSTLGPTLTITRGAGGSGVSGTTGGSGGTSSVTHSGGTLVSASGGAGGASTAANAAPGAVGGGWQAQSFTGTIQIPGQGGGTGARLGTGGSIGGMGGSSHLGAGGAGSGNGSTPVSGSGYGGGGGGACLEQSAVGAVAGAAGSNGVIRITFLI